MFPKAGETGPNGDVNLVTRLLDVVENEIVPITRQGVSEGNKLFGAAVLDRSSLRPVVVGTNRETQNPLLHGEISALNDYWALPAGDRTSPAACVFLSTHEPCSLCLSAITWSGFDSFYYLFSYEDSRDAFAIPHDLRILEEVFGVADGAYRRTNAFWSAHDIADLVESLPAEAATAARHRLDRLRAVYDELSASYQATKDNTEIPLN
ncbi:MAG: nucleoside deaminase [Acidimicrobiales bacterium]